MRQRHPDPFRLVLLAAAAAVGLAMPADAGPHLDRITAEGRINIGVRIDTPPFAYVEDGQPRGFVTELCGMMAGAILTTSTLEGLNAHVVTVSAEDRFDRLISGEIDLLCGATTVTLSRREQMSFTLPIFATGIGGLVSADASPLLREVLITGGPAAFSANAIREALAGKKLGVRAGTTAEDWLVRDVMRQAEDAEIVRLDDHHEGVDRVAEGAVDVYFADRAILAGILTDDPELERFELSEGTYTYEPYALAIPRGDEELRLVMDRALSHLYRSGAIFEVYERHFGPPGPDEQIFYGLNALPE
ncbi:MAG: amino acid ABC transporter substrate-binding protein [Pseudomonadota bacterium]